MAGRGLEVAAVHRVGLVTVAARGQVEGLAATSFVRDDRLLLR